MKISLTTISLVFTVGLLVVTTGCNKMIMKTDVVYDPDTSWVYDTTVIVPEPEPVKEIEITFGDVVAPVYFDYDSYDLSPNSIETLKKIAEFLEKENNNTISIKIEGHTDERGTHGYNQALGQRRADAVKSYFKSYGIDASRLGTVSYGEIKPVATGTTEEDYAQNRRSEMKEK